MATSSAGSKATPWTSARFAYDTEGHWLLAALDRAVGVFDANDRSGASSSGRRTAARWLGSPSARTAGWSLHRWSGRSASWALDIDLLLDVARANVSRTLTDDECRRTST